MESKDSVVVKLSGGSIRGFLVEDGRMFRARGVKFATAARFGDPELVEAWADIWDCTKPAPMSPQAPSALAMVTGPIGDGWPQSEDCLHVSIAAPFEAVSAGQGNQSGLLPVMVFYHGGAYVTGGGDLDCYDPTALARHGAIVVNVTYRLGIFGYPKSDTLATPNLGLLDQITSLKWVQKNIAYLGGDAGNVTVFGHSAGADSAFAMLLINEVQHLFHRAILQSAPWGTRAMPFSRRERMEKLMGKAIRDCIGTRDVASITTEEMINTVSNKALLAASKHPAGLVAYGPSFSLPPLQEITKAELKLDDISRCRKPILISYTRDDGSIFASTDNRLRALSHTPVIKSIFLPLKQWYYSRQIFGWGSEKLFRKVNSSGGQATIVRFSHRFQRELGACHCVELPYLFGSWSEWEAAPMVHGPGAKQVIEGVGPEVQKLWVAFASGSDLAGQRFNINDSFSFSGGPQSVIHKA